MKNRLIVLSLIVLIIITQSCRDYDSDLIPILSTIEVSSITPLTAFSGGIIDFENGGEVISRGICWSKTPVPTVNDNKTSDGSGSGLYSSYITGLEAGTQYYIRAYASNSYGVAYGQELSFNTHSEIAAAAFNPDLDYGTVTDIDGNIYRTIQIGNQVWMAENLKTTRYNDNSHIPKVRKYLLWSEIYEPVSGWYLNDSVTFNKVSGALYNWYAVSNDKLCPVGWHLPSNEEFKELAGYLGINGAAGGKLKESGYIHWNYPNDGATNESGFTALPAGVLNITAPGTVDEWSAIGPYGFWWSSTEINPENEMWDSYVNSAINGFYMDSAIYFSLISEFRDAGKIIINYANKQSGFSVRCLKD